VLDVIKDLHEGPEALFRDAQQRIDQCFAGVESLRETMEERCRGVEERTAGSVQELAGLLDTAQARAAMMQQQLRAEQARLDEADKALRGLFEMHARENKVWKDKTELRMQADHEMALRVREVFAGELRQIQSTMAEERRGQDLKWQQMDSKLTDDSRKMLQAMQAMRAAHEALKASTDDHFAQVLAHDEKNLTRLWADVNANRAHCDKHIEDQRARLSAEEHARKEADAEQRSAVEALRHDVAHKSQLLHDALAQEGSSRAVEHAALQDALAALREHTEVQAKLLGGRVEELDAALKEELREVREEALEDNQRHVIKGEELAQRADDLDKRLQLLDDEKDGLKALLAGVQDTAAADRAHAREGVEELRRGLREEEQGRQAAVTEVYRRMAVAREMDALVTQVVHGEMERKVREVREHMHASEAAAESGVEAKLQRVSGLIAQLQQADEGIKLMVEDVSKQTKQCVEELRSVDEELLRKVDESERLVVRKTSQVQDKVADTDKTVRQELAAVQSTLASSLQEVQGSMSEAVHRLEAAVAAEREERGKSLEQRSAEWEEALSNEAAARQAAVSAQQQAREDAEKKEREARVAAEAGLAQRITDLSTKEEALVSSVSKADETAAELAATLEGKLAEEREKREEESKALEERLLLKMDSGAASASADIGAKVEEVVGKVQEMSSKVEEMRDKVGEVSGEVEKVSGKVGEVAERAAQTAERMETMEEGKAKLEADVHEVALLRGKVEEIEGSYVKSEMLDAYVKSDALEAALAESAKVWGLGYAV
jgi:hypothetical protein